MKRLVLLAMMCMFLLGCGTLAKEAEFWDHQSVYKSGDHFWFSVMGYAKCDTADVQKSRQEGWWGITAACEGCAPVAAAAAAPAPAAKPVLAQETKDSAAPAPAIAPADKEKKKDPAQKKTKKKKVKKSKKKKVEKPQQ